MRWEIGYERHKVRVTVAEVIGSREDAERIMATMMDSTLSILPVDPTYCGGSDGDAQDMAACRDAQS